MPLPWTTQTPLMLAPMQGLTNRAFRAAVATVGRPDVLFTEFVRVRPQGRALIAASDFVEATTEVEGIPLVVQVIGSADDGVVEAVTELVDRGVTHINVNMGCPFGRMTSVLAGGGMFRFPETIAPMLSTLRDIVPGSLSVKTRAGLEHTTEILPLLSTFEECGVDFIAVHPRTVAQKYSGVADHGLTAEIVAATSLAVIANGDIRTADDATRVLDATNAIGVMLGRGAVADPHIFDRIRGKRVAQRPIGDDRTRELAQHWRPLLNAYADVFCGDAQVMAKFRENLAHVNDDDQQRWLKSLRKAKRVSQLAQLLDAAAA